MPLITTEITLIPADNDRLANLCGQLNIHLRHIEARLQVNIANRANLFKITGSEASVKAASVLLQKLFDNTETEQLSSEQVHLAMQDASIDEMLSSESVDAPQPITIKTKFGTIKGRGFNQQDYLRKITTHDINFGVGPAGTGKTYLAVACAIEALLHEKS